MLLQSIVTKLDAELDRLQKLRRIVHGISCTSPLDGLLMELNQLQRGTPAVLPAAQTQVQLAPQPEPTGRLSGMARGRTRNKHPESRALTSTIPAAPVVVYAAQVASERQRRVPARAANGKNKTAAILAKPRMDAIPSVEALRNRWLAEG